MTPQLYCIVSADIILELIDPYPSLSCTSHNMSTTIVLALGLAALSGVQAQNTCYRYGRPYRCNGGLGYGARIGIGVGIAAGTSILFRLYLYLQLGVLLLFLLCGYWKRKYVHLTYLLGYG
jgi:hypothetical protein